jgi:hypothetical protein
MNALDYLKIVGSHVVLTAFRDRHNQLVDRIIYDIKVELNEDGSTRLDFYMNQRIVSVTIPTKLAQLQDVRLKEPLAVKDVLYFDGEYWTNGVAENNDYGNSTFIRYGDTYNIAFRTLDDILALLAPAKPQSLSAKALIIPGSYSAIQTSTNVLRSHVTSNTTPTITFTDGAYDGAAGDVSATLLIGGDSVIKTTSKITLTPEVGADIGKTVTDLGLNLRLTITEDYDFHAGIAGKQGFWIAFTANADVIKALPYQPEEHKASIIHSLTGKAELIFYTDDAILPVLSLTSVSTTAPGTTKISGVPTLITNDLIDISFRVNSAIRNFYRENIARVSSVATTLYDFNISLTSTKVHGQVYDATRALPVNNNVYSEDVVFTFSGFNSRGEAGIAPGRVTNKKIRVDTISKENRLTSGVGRLPAVGTYGTAYTTTKSAESLLAQGNEELQLVGGKYQYPSGDYTSNYPVAGPNYNSITSGFRYVTFAIDIVETSTVTIFFEGAENFSAYMNENKTLDSTKFSLQIKVDGSKPTNGWLDGNLPYPGGNPMLDNDGALILASTNTTANNKDIAFGTANKTGKCYIRIGLNFQSSNKMKFSGIRVVAG